MKNREEQIKALSTKIASQQVIGQHRIAVVTMTEDERRLVLVALAALATMERLG